jgi:antitoxin Phd
MSDPTAPTSKSWQVQDAKARFSEMLEKALTDGPQVVTRRGKEAAVLVAAELWRELELRARPSLKELLLSQNARTDALAPERRKIRLRPLVALD